MISTKPQYSIIPAQKEHLPYLAKHMRLSDKEEVWAADMHTPLEALTKSYTVSIASWCLMQGESPMVIGGVAPYQSALGKRGTPWFLATPALYKIPKYAAQHLRLHVEYIALLYPILLNYTFAKNKQAHRFLRWCGFTVANKPVPYGPKNELFYPFWRKTCVESLLQSLQ